MRASDNGTYIYIYIYIYIDFNLFAYLLFHYNDNKFSDETQEKSRSDTVPQCNEKQRNEVGRKLTSQETEPFVQIPGNKGRSSVERN